MKVVIIFGFLTVVWCQTTNVQQCSIQSNESTLPLNTYVHGCTNPPCLFPQLESTPIEILFRSPRPIKSMVTDAHAYLLGIIGVKYDLGPAAATCNSVSCPLHEGQVVSYQLDMHIEEWMPVGTAVTVEFVIRDEADNSAIMCVRIPIRIIPPVNRLAQQTNPAVPLGNTPDPPTAKNTTGFTLRVPAEVKTTRTPAQAPCAAVLRIFDQGQLS